MGRRSRRQKSHDGSRYLLHNFLLFDASSIKKCNRAPPSANDFPEISELDYIPFVMLLMLSPA